MNDQHKLVQEDVLRNIVKEALAELLKADQYLLKHDVSERALSHRLAVHVERALESKEGSIGRWNVDCEYNRDVTNPHYPYSKRLDLPKVHDISNEEPFARTVFPDIIVHRRGTTENLLVIEIKKTNNPEGPDFDVSRKIPAFLSQMGYNFG